MPFSMRTRWTCLTALLVALVVLLPLPVAAKTSSEAMSQRIDAVVSRAIAEQRIVGAVVMVARDGRIVYKKAFGLADKELRIPVRADTMFRLASMTKPIVSAAAMALVDQGKLSLDDPVTRWLPEFAPRLPDGKPAVITVRQLLTHTAGLSYGFREPGDGPLAKAKVSDGLDRPGITLDEELRRLASVPLRYEPGTSWQYSLAIDVLGAVVAKAGGGSLPEVVSRLVTGPLGMTDTLFVVTRPDRLATAYVRDANGPHRMRDPETMPFGASGIRYQPSRATDSNAYPSGGAGMSGTAPDYMKFLEAIRQNGGTILQPQTVQAMTDNQIGDIAADVVGPGWGWGFGAAVLVDPQKSQYPGAPGTWRWGGVYGSHFFMDRASGLSVVVLTNTTPDGMDGTFPQDIAKAVYGR